MGLRKIVLLAAVAVSVNAHAWTRASDQRIAQKSAALAPPDLRMLLERFDTEYKHGVEMAEADEGSDAHNYFVISRRGHLRERIERETNATIAAIRRGDPMPGVVERLGTLAHLVADANNPFHVANDNSRLTPSHDDFEQYFERRLAKFPTVFYGLDPKFQLGSFLDRTFDRTAKFYPLIGEEYFRGGAAHTSADFDDHSTAFGVAAVCYSRAVTDLVNLYYYVWRQSGGDVRAASAMRDGNLQLTTP